MLSSAGYKRRNVNNVLLNKILYKNENSVKQKKESRKEKSCLKKTAFGVIDGARTHDPQNHNLML